MPRQDGRSREEEEDECASYGGSIDQNESRGHTSHTHTLYTKAKERSERSADTWPERRGARGEAQGRVDITPSAAETIDDDADVQSARKSAEWEGT